MSKLLIKLGCFLTGYNYNILKNCSEASIKCVKKYLSAILIISLLWGFIGYVFTERYLHGDVTWCIAGSLIMVFVVIEIERQIILTIKKNNVAALFRTIIGILMAILGSVILDQIIFKVDIENHNRENIEAETNRLTDLRTKQLQGEIIRKDSAIAAKERERRNTIANLQSRPLISAPSSVVQYEKDSVTGKMVAIRNTVTKNSVQNPEAELIPQIQSQIKNLMDQRTELENRAYNERDSVKVEVESNVGFLDELDVLFAVIGSSWKPMAVWIMIFLFFLSLELFVLATKFFGDSENDYDRIIMHQLEFRIIMIEKLAQKNDLDKIS